ncbi:ribonuclease H-like domain-containing protein [Halarchaeum sp. CBA1220]|uniref:ribonuclease H-like domain-containing protein n=1 Tax=Halarchaeum sp. CBA1220 TaxID=1853682 RepID=UPI000F3AA777|nr:ribonuclease H-like domain-containing protein [Halarchaeum sp. CBA1220]QLC33983.1 ribonuclease H-like domain-containing protein [Halarchaeum sp. CBA1220]
MRVENSFIAAEGVGPATERSLWADGVHHWDDFDTDYLGEKTGRRVADYIDTARERLDSGDASFFAETLPSGELWRAYENFADGACFFDIETTGLDAATNDVTTVSFHRSDGTRTLVRGDDLTRETVRAELDSADLLVSFNGKRFDVPFLAQSFDLDVTTPHLDLMYTCKKLDLSGGLKAIESDLGLERDGVEDVDGREAVRLWKRYERENDEAALDRLVTYNRYDAENLRALADRVTSDLHEETFVPHR